MMEHGFRSRQYSIRTHTLFTITSYCLTKTLAVSEGHVVLRMEEVTWKPLNRSPLRTQKSPCYHVNSGDFLLKLVSSNH